MPMHRITIESIRPHRPTETKHELAFRVFISDDMVDDFAAEAPMAHKAGMTPLEMIAAKMLTAWCTEHPGVPATYITSGLSAAEQGERW